MSGKQSYSITSSAVASSLSGTVRPRAFANQVNDEVELGRLLDRDISRLGPAQNLVDIVTGASKLGREARPIGHETSGFDRLLLRPCSRVRHGRDKPSHDARV